jgi:hypothetical protein
MIGGGATAPMGKKTVFLVLSEYSYDHHVHSDDLSQH